MVMENMLRPMKIRRAEVKKIGSSQIFSDS